MAVESAKGSSDANSPMKSAKGKGRGKAAPKDKSDAKPPGSPAAKKGKGRGRGKAAPKDESDGDAKRRRKQ